MSKNKLTDIKVYANKDRGERDKYSKDIVRYWPIFRFHIILHIVPMRTYREPLTEMYSLLPAKSAVNVFMQYKDQVGV